MQLWKEPISPLGLFFHMIWVEHIHFFCELIIIAFDNCTIALSHVCKFLVLAYMQLRMIAINIISSNSLLSV